MNGTIITAMGIMWLPRYRKFFTRIQPVDFSTCTMSWLNRRISSSRMLIWLFTRVSAFWFDTAL